MNDLLAFPATTGLILANLVASLAAFRSQGFLNQNIFHVGAIRSRWEYHRLITSGFLHLNTLHLAVNMITLYFFGPYIERVLGVGDYLIIYFTALLGGNLWSLLEHAKQPNYGALGASGAVSGVVIAFCLFEPFAMLGIFFIIPMPAIVFAILYIALSAYLSTRPNTVVGHDAHLGGAITGGLVTVFLHPEAWTSFTRALSELFN
ncbi:MAG: rhomboid family intramembrane serine protease [Pseudomonadota bacterium]